MLAIIGGTSLRVLALENPVAVETRSPWGQPSQTIVTGALAGCPVAFLDRHGPRAGIPPHRINYRANIDALAGLGVRAIVAVTAVGGIRPGLASGSLVVPDQIIDYTWGRGHTFSDGEDCPLKHIDFTHPFDPGLRQRLLTTARQAAVTVTDGGVYGVAQGPRLETAAEIRRMAGDGCDLVGMTAMPEAALAREAGIPYVGLALVVNPAAGTADQLICVEDIDSVTRRALPSIIAVLEQFCRAG